MNEINVLSWTPVLVLQKCVWFIKTLHQVTCVIVISPGGAEQWKKKSYIICDWFSLKGICKCDILGIFFAVGVTDSIPEIWLLDRSLRWTYLASSFQNYFRMLIVHLGLPLWQYRFTKTGLSPETKVLREYKLSPDSRDYFKACSHELSVTMRLRSDSHHHYSYNPLTTFFPQTTCILKKHYDRWYNHNVFSF